MLPTDITDNWLLAEQQRNKETSSVGSNFRNLKLPEAVAITFEI